MSRRNGPGGPAARILASFGAAAVVLLAYGLVAGSVARGSSNGPDKLYLPFVASGGLAPTATPAVVVRGTTTATPGGSTPTAVLTSTPSATPAASSTASASPAVSQPIVFVSRQIPPSGSQFDTATNTMPGVGAYSRYEVAAPGKLLIRNPDGSLKVLIDGSSPTSASLNLIDVDAPDVSYDGTQIVFAGLPNGTYTPGPKGNPSAWRIYAIGVDGTNLRQMTSSDQNLDLSQFGSEGQNLAAYDDTDPIWLPDGRICFSSTRWPESAEYEGVRSSNLYVVNADGSNLHRITSEKNGANRPLVDPITGRIVFARWWRNDRFAINDMSTIYYNGVDSSEGYVQFNGLTTDRTTEVGNPPTYDNLNQNWWQTASINPDGTNLQAWRMVYRDSEDNHYYGGAFTPQGVLFGNYFPTANLAESGGFGGIRLLQRGFVPYQGVIGMFTDQQQQQVCSTCFGVYAGNYAADPAVLPNGQLVISWARDTNQDYGLYVVNQDGSGLTPLYDNPGTSELRARVVEARLLPPIIPDSVTQVAPQLPPLATGPYNTGGTFTFQDLNVYFNAPVDSPIVNAPAVGSASTIRFFTDFQRTGQGSVPNTDWPILLGTATVGPDGSLINTQAPADIPLFEQIRDPNNNVPLTHDPYTVNGAAHVAGMNYGRPGTTMQCVGCHAGHSLIAVPANPQFTNLAPGAAVTTSSLGTAAQNGGMPSTASINNREVLNEGFTNYWRSAPGKVAGEWVELAFPVPITVQDVRLYNPVGGTDIYSDQDNLQVQGATVTLYSDAAGTQPVASQNVGPLTTTPGAGTDVNFSNVTAQVVKVTINSESGTFDGQPAASLAEIEVIASGG